MACGLLAATAAMPLFPSAVITTANPRAGEVGRLSKRIVGLCARSIVPRMPRVRLGAHHRRNRRRSPGRACLSTADDGSMPLVSFSAAQYGWRGVTGTLPYPRPRSPALEGVRGVHGPVRDDPGGQVCGEAACSREEDGARRSPGRRPLTRPAATHRSSSPGLTPHRHAGRRGSDCRSRPHMASRRARSSRRFAGRPPRGPGADDRDLLHGVCPRIRSDACREAGWPVAPWWATEHDS